MADVVVFRCDAPTSSGAVPYTTTMSRAAWEELPESTRESVLRMLRSNLADHIEKTRGERPSLASLLFTVDQDVREIIEKHRTASGEQPDPRSST